MCRILEIRQVLTVTPAAKSQTSAGIARGRTRLNPFKDWASARLRLGRQHDREQVEKPEAKVPFPPPVHARDSDETCATD